jgi:hypothetical protein
MLRSLAVVIKAVRTFAAIALLFAVCTSGELALGQNLVDRIRLATTSESGEVADMSRTEIKLNAGGAGAGPYQSCKWSFC